MNKTLILKPSRAKLCLLTEEIDRIFALFLLVF